MKKIFFLLFSFLSQSILVAQNLEGIVKYTRETSWVKIQAQLPYLSKEEKDRAKLTWGDNTWKENYLFTFNKEASIYEPNPEQESDEEWSSRLPVLSLYRNYAQGTKLDVEEMLGKVYVVEDSLVAPNWKIQNKIKEVAGHLCMLAIMEDTVKKQKIEAWFAQDLPINGGPEHYTGLPGLILEVNINDGCVVITADKITLQTLEKGIKPPKKKGKRIKNTEYTSLIDKHIKDSMKSYRNPFWSMRY
ncbi:MAG: GLPGLI family protein [Thermoflexibacteraceae bacterium]